MDVDGAIDREPAEQAVLDIVLAPLKEIVIALAPFDHAVVVADLAQQAVEFLRLARDGRGQHGFQIGDAIEHVVAHHEFLRLARAADQRIAAVAGSAQRGGNEIDALGNGRIGARLYDQLVDARFAGERRARAETQRRTAGDQAQKRAAGRALSCSACSNPNVDSF